MNSSLSQTVTWHSTMGIRDPRRGSWATLARGALNFGPEVNIRAIEGCRGPAPRHPRQAGWTGLGHLLVFQVTTAKRDGST